MDSIQIENPAIRLLKCFGDSRIAVARALGRSREAVRLWLLNGIPPELALTVEEATMDKEHPVTAAEVLRFARDRKAAAEQAVVTG